MLRLRDQGLANRLIARWPGHLLGGMAKCDRAMGLDDITNLPVATEEMYGVFSPDRSRMLTGGYGCNPKIQIWDVETGNCLRVLTGHRSRP